MSKLVHVVLDVRLSPSVGTRVGFRRSCSPCRLVGVRGEQKDEVFMGARRSTTRVSAR